MATNIVYDPGTQLSVVCTNPTTPAAGDPVRYGNLCGIALTDEADGGNPTGYTSVHFGPFVADLSVKAVDDNGNSAVAVGDAIFYVDADTPKLSKKQAGYFFGFALEAITSGATDTINVHKLPTAGSGAIASSGVTTTKIADDAVTTIKIAANQVTAAKLTATMATGYIPLPLAQAREIGSNDIINTAGDAGVLSKNTTPIFERVNGATDKQLRLNWAASNDDEIVWSVVSPPDLDDAAAVEVHLLAAMESTNDTPVIGVSFFEGVGDSNAGGNTAAVTGTAVAEYSVSIAHGDIAASPKAWSIGLTPAAHGTDKLYLYGAWIEYTRK